MLSPPTNIPWTDRLCAAVCVQWVTLLVMTVQYAYACLIMDGYKTGESRNTMHVANHKGLFIALYAQQRSEDWDATEMMEMLRELWPGMPDSALEENRKARFEHGCIWGLVSLGDTYTKTCCKQPCSCTCEHLDGVWCPERKDICVDSSWKFRHVTQLENPIPLRFPVHVRPMPGLFRQRIPLAAIPLENMTVTQQHLWRHSVSEMSLN